MIQSRQQKPLLYPQVLPTIFIVLLLVAVHLIISICMEIRAFIDKNQEWEDKTCWALSIIVTCLCLFLLFFKMIIPSWNDDESSSTSDGNIIMSFNVMLSLIRISLIIIILLGIHAIISILMDVRAFIVKDQKWEDKTCWTLSIVVTFLCMIFMYFKVRTPMYIRINWTQVNKSINK
jgi:hypothetical protein